MHLNDRGEGRAKAIIATVVLLLVGFAAIKIIPVYVNNYELADHIHDLAIRATVSRTTEDDVKNEIVNYARENDIPITQENIKVVLGARVTIDIDYKVPVNLLVSTWTLHFTPSAENQRL